MYNVHLTFSLICFPGGNCSWGEPGHSERLCWVSWISGITWNDLTHLDRTDCPGRNQCTIEASVREVSIKGTSWTKSFHSPPKSHEFKSPSTTPSTFNLSISFRDPVFSSWGQVHPCSLHCPFPYPQDGACIWMIHWSVCPWEWWSFEDRPCFSPDLRSYLLLPVIWYCTMWPYSRVTTPTFGCTSQDDKSFLLISTSLWVL